MGSGISAAEMHFSSFNQKYTHGLGESSAGKRRGGMEEVGSRAIGNTGKQKWRCRGVEAPEAAGKGELDGTVDTDGTVFHLMSGLGWTQRPVVPRPHHTLDQKEPLLQ